MIAIIGILVALLLPAVQSARESARKITCVNNMKQLGIAVLSYEDTKKELPPSHFNDYSDPAHPRRDFHSFLTYLLPYVEQQAVADQYDWSKRGTVSPNFELCKSSTIEIFICPTTPPGAHDRAGAADYAICDKISDSGDIRNLATAGKLSLREHWESMLATWVPSGVYEQSRRGGVTIDHTSHDYIIPKLRMVTDGQSNSLMIFEDAGRPDRYDSKGPVGRTTGGALWSDGEAWYDVHHTCGEALQNCNNNHETFSFHINGCNYTMGDGAVRFVSDEIDPDVYVSLFTRRGDDLVEESEN